MVSIIIHQQHPIHFTADLKSAPTPGKYAQGLDDLLPVDLQAVSQGKRCQGIEHIMLTRDLEGNWQIGFPHPDPVSRAQNPSLLCSSPEDHGLNNPNPDF